MRQFTIFVISSLCYGGCHAFVANSHPLHKKCSTEMNLVPEQGCQLVAASAAASAKAEEDIHLTPTQATHEFASRIFSIPSYILPNVDQSWLHSLPEHIVKFYKEDEDDIVVFPLVGFTLARGNGSEMKVLPPPKVSRSSCNIQAVRQTKEEPVYGWFSPCCPLGDLHSDGETYCGCKNEDA